MWEAGGSREWETELRAEILHDRVEAKRICHLNC
jgi:hypothetical protein